MKFVDFVRKCKKSCAPASEYWMDISYELTDTTLVITARKAGKKTNPRQELGSFHLPEKVVGLPTPSWIYDRVAAQRLGVDTEDTVHSSVFADEELRGKSNTGSILMFASEARKALEEFQRQTTAALKA